MTETEVEFKGWPKTPRLTNETFSITEKLDGTNAQIYIHEDGTIQAGSRTQWLSEEKDNYGFYKWVQERRGSLITNLAPGRYYGEFIGAGIQRKYNLSPDKRLYLFHLRENMLLCEPKSVCLSTLCDASVYFIPMLAEDIPFNILLETILDTHMSLLKNGSSVNNYKYPEGMIIKSSSGQRWKFFVYEKAPKEPKMSKIVRDILPKTTNTSSTDDHGGN